MNAPAPMLRKGLPPIPPRMTKLPIDARGYPIPWFVQYVDGKPDFRVANQHKRWLGVNKKRCWLCGEDMGQYFAFVIGPMCAVNRNTSEPGCHKDCALFAVQACPFMVLPKAEYRRANLPVGATNLPAGLPGNPGAVCLWITKSFHPYRVEDSWLIRLGPPEEVLWYAEGKPATREKIIMVLDDRLPLLQQAADAQGQKAQAHLVKLVKVAMEFLPA